MTFGLVNSSLASSYKKGSGITNFFFLFGSSLSFLSLSKTFSIFPCSLMSLKAVTGPTPIIIEAHWENWISGSITINSFSVITATENAKINKFFVAHIKPFYHFFIAYLMNGFFFIVETSEEVGSSFSSGTKLILCWRVRKFYWKSKHPYLRLPLHKLCQL